ncbi:MAG TPA: phytanoyl-CoA dioxygenase family protein [Rhizomicrobium sp.]|nr:phytanoyl-CoA dioxygenase family protein [Rhizomicrobium sp.]
MVTLFMNDGGRGGDFLARIVAAIHPPYELPPAKGVLGELTAGSLSKINQQLERDGYCVFENALSAEFCDGLLRRSLDFEYMLSGDEEMAAGLRQTGKYDRANPKATQYSLTRDDTTALPEVQELVSDPSIIAVAQNYLKSKPIFSGIWMGWSAKIKDTPDSNAAQEFHWDMERVRWLRFFVYITDVGTENGPHCFIKGSHRTGAIPKDLRELGYVRHRDGTIIQRFGHENFREFTGGRGTIIAEDSRGFHKGKLLAKGDRLMIAFELSNTTFGVNKRHLIRNIHVPRLAEFAKRYPRLYRNFDFAGPL